MQFRFECTVEAGENLPLGVFTTGCMSVSNSTTNGSNSTTNGSGRRLSAVHAQWASEVKSASSGGTSVYLPIPTPAPTKDTNK